jgi:hypothetical protein
MIELKTLKDFEKNKNFMGDNILRDEVKKEAVKWVKAIHTSIHNKTEYLKQEKIREDYGFFKGNNWKENSPLYEWVKHFFNITEEDLEEKE